MVVRVIIPVTRSRKSSVSYLAPKTQIPRLNKENIPPDMDSARPRRFHLALDSVGYLFFHGLSSINAKLASKQDCLASVFRDRSSLLLLSCLVSDLQMIFYVHGKEVSMVKK